MKRKVEDGDAIDVSKCEREGRYYVLTKFVDGADYCDNEKTAWIWSIGFSRRSSAMGGLHR